MNRPVKAYSRVSRAGNEHVEKIRLNAPISQWSVDESGRMNAPVWRRNQIADKITTGKFHREFARLHGHVQHNSHSENYVARSSADRENTSGILNYEPTEKSIDWLTYSALDFSHY